MTEPTNPQDPLVEQQLDRTLERYKGLASPAMLATMRAQLGEMLTTDPQAVAMMEQLREHAAPDHSGSNPVEGADDPGETSGGTQGA